MHTRSGEHCKISSSDEDRDVYLYDLSCNGTYINGALVGKDSRQLLKNGDTVTLLDPAKPNHYQFLFQDLRPQPPPPPPPPPLPLPAAARSPSKTMTRPMSTAAASSSGWEGEARRRRRRW